MPESWVQIDYTHRLDDIQRLVQAGHQLGLLIAIECDFDSRRQQAHRGLSIQVVYLKGQVFFLFDAM